MKRNLFAMRLKLEKHGVQSNRIPNLSQVTWTPEGEINTRVTLNKHQELLVPIPGKQLIIFF